MRKRPLGNTGLSVSELALGTWGLSGDGYAPLADVEQDVVIDRALSLGVTLFDTADSYGKGAMERKLGQRLKDKEAVIVTKLGTDREAVPPRKCFKPAFLRQAFEASRERLQRAVVDVVLLHNPSERTLERGEATGALSELKSNGAIRAWGVSVGSTSVAREAIKQGAEVLELAYNAFHSRTLRELEAEIRDKEIGILARSVLAHGLLCGQWPTNKEFASGDHRVERWTTDDLKRRISQLNALRPCVVGSVTSLRAAAVRFVLANERVSAAVLGPRGSLQLDQLLRDAGKEPPYLTPESLSALDLRLANVGVNA
ncbi:MAG TPA: aldo/keto reductase [Polyangiaceae bacterium]|jgi:aryl-alcohol dehydrogenase-like predicted oxidoreductase